MRPASEVEILAKMVKYRDRLATPMSDLLRQFHSTVDVTKEPNFNPKHDLLPEEPRPEGEVNPREGELATSPDEWRGPSHGPDANSRSRLRSRKLFKQRRQRK